MFFFDRKPYSDFSEEILSQCESGMIAGFLTPVIFSNMYYILRRIAAHSKVIEKLKQLLLITDILKMDKSTVIHALNSKFNDFEDALQNYSTVSNKEIDVILTRNLKDYKHSELSIMTPETFLKMQSIKRDRGK
ncbi:MAG: PIN domain-containing protein [Bacteroidota bacterium]